MSRSASAGRGEKIACAVALCGALGCSIYDESLLNSDGGAAATGGSGGTGGSGATGGTPGKGGADGGAGNGGASGSSGANGTGGTGGASGTGGSGTTGGATGVGGAAGTAGTGGTGATGGAAGTGTGTGGAAGSGGAAGTGGTGAGGTAGTSGTGGVGGAAGKGGAAGTGGTGATGGAAGASGTGGAAGSAGTGGGTVDAGPDGGPGPTGGGNTLIIAEHSGKCMTVIGNGTADGTNIEQQPCTSSAGQVYRFQNQGGGVYKILHVASGRYVSGNGPATNDYVVEIRTSSTSTLQQFNVVLDNGVYYSLVNLAAGYCLDVYMQQTTDGAEYVTYTCNGQSNQAFRFVSP